MRLRPRSRQGIQASWRSPARRPPAPARARLRASAPRSPPSPGPQSKRPARLALAGPGVVGVPSGAGAVARSRSLSGDCDRDAATGVAGVDDVRPRSREGTALSWRSPAHWPPAPDRARLRASEPRSPASLGSQRKRPTRLAFGLVRARLLDPDRYQETAIGTPRRGWRGSMTSRPRSRAGDCAELAIACAGAAGSGSRSVAGFGASVAGKPWVAADETGATGVPSGGGEVARSRLRSEDCDGAAATGVVSVDDGPSAIPTVNRAGLAMACAGAAGSGAPASIRSAPRSTDFNSKLSALTCADPESPVAGDAKPRNATGATTASALADCIGLLSRGESVREFDPFVSAAIASAPKRIPASAMTRESLRRPGAPAMSTTIAPTKPALIAMSAVALNFLRSGRLAVVRPATRDAGARAAPSVRVDLALKSALSVPL